MHMKFGESRNESIWKFLFLKHSCIQLIMKRQTFDGKCRQSFNHRVFEFIEKPIVQISFEKTKTKVKQLLQETNGIQIIEIPNINIKIKNIFLMKFYVHFSTHRTSKFQSMCFFFIIFFEYVKMLQRYITFTLGTIY